MEDLNLWAYRMTHKMQLENIQTIKSVNLLHEFTAFE